VLKHLLPVLDFLNRTGAPFVMNIYPFFQYRATQEPVCHLTKTCFNMSVEFATGRPGADPLVDIVSGIKYRSLLELSIDGIRVALSKLGYGHLTMFLGETGWPSQGAPWLGTTLRNSCEYLNNVVSVMESGTPSAPGVPLFAYYFEWNDEAEKWAWSGKKADPGVIENHWGVTDKNRQLKFPVDLLHGRADCSRLPDHAVPSAAHPRPYAQQQLDGASSFGIFPLAVAVFFAIAFITSLGARLRFSRANSVGADPEGQYAQLG